MKSLTQVSLNHHISKAALIQRINKISKFRARFCKRKKNKLLISDKGIKLIAQPKHNSTSKQFHTRKGTNSQLTKKDLIKQNKKLISTIISQQRTIESQQKSISNNKSQQSKLSDKQSKTSNNAILPESFDEGIARKEIRKYKRHGPIYRFFHNIEK